jgi:hypothetical protein
MKKTITLEIILNIILLIWAIYIDSLYGFILLITIVLALGFGEVIAKHSRGGGLLGIVFREGVTLAVSCGLAVIIEKMFSYVVAMSDTQAAGQARIKASVAPIEGIKGIDSIKVGADNAEGFYHSIAQFFEGYNGMFGMDAFWFAILCYVLVRGFASIRHVKRSK